MDNNVDELRFSVPLPPNQRSFDGDELVYLKADLHERDGRVRDLVDRLSIHSSQLDQRSLTLESSASVQSSFPELWQLARTMNELLRRGVSTLVVEDLPFARVDLARSKQAFLAFASCIGRPVSADPHRLNLVWEVCPKSRLPSDYTPTITEHCGDAALHTDSAFKRSPETYVMLFAYKPASDGGGLSQVLSAQRLLKSLSKSPQGRKCIRLLGQTRFPFQVPTAFTKARLDSVVEWVSAPILSGRGKIRYRHDLIASALDHGVTSLSPESQWAIIQTAREIENLKPRSISLRSGDLLVLNNHKVLHGRTAFGDRDRMLLRVRLATAHQSLPVEEPYDHTSRWRNAV